MCNVSRDTRGDKIRQNQKKIEICEAIFVAVSTSPPISELIQIPSRYAVLIKLQAQHFGGI